MRQRRSGSRCRRWRQRQPETDREKAAGAVGSRAVPQKKQHGFAQTGVRRKLQDMPRFKPNLDVDYDRAAIDEKPQSTFPPYVKNESLHGNRARKRLVSFGHLRVFYRD